MKFLPLAFFAVLACFAEAQIPAAPAPAPASDMVKWLAGLDATWQATFDKEVTAPFDAEMARLGQQYLAAVDGYITKASAAGDLEQTVGWRAERERFVLAKDVPPGDEAAMPAALKQLRGSWRTQAARLQKDRGARATALLGRYDLVLAQAQKQLTQAQRIDDALLLKKAREDVATRWTPAVVAPAVVAAPAEPAKPSVAPGNAKPPVAVSPATPASKTAKLAPRELLEKLLATGVQVRIGEYRSQKEIRQVNEAPDKFAFYSLRFRPRTDGVPVGDEDLALLESLPSLAALGLEGIDVTDAGLEHLRSLRTLQYLDFTNLAKVTGPGLKVLNDIPTLESLKLFSMPAAEAVIKAVAATKRLPQVTIGTMEISEAAFAALSVHPALSHLEFEKGATGFTPGNLAHLVKMKKLTRLHFIDFPIDDAMAAELGKLDGLQHLSIRQSSLTEAGVVSLGRLRNLTDLVLTTPPVTPATLVAFKKLKALRNLTVTRATPAEDLAKLRAALKGVTVKE